MATQGTMSSVSDLLLISPELRARSRSRDEIVLSYEEAVRAIGELRSQRVPLLGWEGLIVEPAGRIVFPGEVRGTGSLERDAGESWDAYVSRTCAFCLVPGDRARATT